MTGRSRYWWPPELAAVVDALRESGWDVDVSRREYGDGRGRWCKRRGGRRQVMLHAVLGDRFAPSGVVSASWSAAAGDDLSRESFEAYVGDPFPNPVLRDTTPAAVLAATARRKEARR